MRTSEHLMEPPHITVGTAADATAFVLIRTSEFTRGQTFAMKLPVGLART